jgi:hypothetical protein
MAEKDKMKRKKLNVKAFATGTCAPAERSLWRPTECSLEQTSRTIAVATLKKKALKLNKRDIMLELVVDIILSKEIYSRLQSSQVIPLDRLVDMIVNYLEKEIDLVAEGIAFEGSNSAYRNAIASCLKEICATAP